MPTDISRAHFYQPKSVIKAFGPDAEAFLQGQFSNDLKGGEERAAVYGLWLNRKGRIVADSFALRGGEDSYWLISYYCGEAQVLERLDSCLVMDEVELHGESGQYSGVSLWGGSIAVALQELELQAPEPGKWRHSEDVFIFWGRRGREDVLECLLQGESGKRLLQKLTAALQAGGVAILGAAELEAMAIEEAVPRVGIDVGDLDLPQEALLEEVAISYRKGCYLGQEVMARIKAMGTVRKKLRSVAIAGEMPSTELPLDLLDASGKKRGSLRAVAVLRNEVKGLAVLPAGTSSESNLHIQNTSTEVTPLEGV